MSEINEHKQYHDALANMGLKVLPENEELLKERRKNLLKQAQTKFLKKASDFSTHKAIDWNIRVKRINSSFELLKSYLNNTFELNRRLSERNFKLDAYGNKI